MKVEQEVPKAVKYYHMGDRPEGMWVRTWLCRCGRTHQDTGIRIKKRKYCACGRLLPPEC